MMFSNGPRLEDVQEDAGVRRSVLHMDFDAYAPLHQSDIGLIRRDIAFIQAHDD